MVFVTGDTHGSYERLSYKHFPKSKQLSKDDIVIICGDFGLWEKGPTENYWFDWLETRPYTICWCDGNHENFDRLYGSEFSIVDFHGGKAHQIRANVYHLMRGYVFDFEDQKFFVFGGASSHDISDGILDRDQFPSDEAFENALYHWRKACKSYRVNHISWWKEELPSQEEMIRGIQSLQQHNFKVDFVISHCLPSSVCSMLGYYTTDILTEYFDSLLNVFQLKFKRWYCGHYHQENAIGSYVIKYENIERIL